ncbi:sulfite exporter TauE/SafE family protein [Salisediminibacterium selenitireducens]|uniref:Probable membrane transporter protein n=1 Tax=Bacillus selenitireducens (strain ATCC 700615 / DSM 15326 / MLS10) TaxID=439292 RepID=D6Y0C6_BACIE|nr:sulfite exporter TauE/SafE family protein [Salisediminibacterium selenitireducens]ADH98517.1 protein of unknown function DUF81 [[Bacillus] selenitireducens MLS10]
MWMDLVIVFAIIMIGSFVQGISGFGFGILAMSFMPFFFTVKDSTLLVVALATILSFSITMQLKKHIEWRSVFLILSFALVGRGFGFLVLHNFGELPVLRVVLGVFLLGVVVYLLVSPKPDPDRKRIPVWIPVLMGLAGGFVGGVFAVGGPFFVFFFLMAFPNNRYAYTANLQVVFFLNSITTVSLHGFSGDYTLNILLFILVGFIAVMAGSRLGVHFLNKVSNEQVKKLAALVVAVAAINLILFGN